MTTIRLPAEVARKLLNVGKVRNVWAAHLIEEKPQVSPLRISSGKCNEFKKVLNAARK